MSKDLEWLLIRVRPLASPWRNRSHNSPELQLPRCETTPRGSLLLQGGCMPSFHLHIPTGLSFIAFPRVICLISTHTNTLVWPIPRYSYPRIPPMTVGHSHSGFRRPSASRRIRVSSKSPPGNRTPPYIQSTRVSRDRLFVAEQAQGGPSELPQNSPNRDTDQTSAR